MFAALALVNEVRWDEASRQLRDEVLHEIGRRMTTSQQNAVTPNVEVTPDCVIQTDLRNGLIAETKLSLPRDDSNWDEDIQQLVKYDDDLIGWWTTDEKIELHDIVALIPLSRAVQFADKIEKAIADGELSFERNLAIVGFFKQSSVREFITLKREWGKLSDAGLDRRLRLSRLIRMDHLIFGYRDRKFIDHKPPMAYLLQIIWDYLFSRYASDANRDEANKWILIETTVGQVTKDLQEFYGYKSAGTRSPEIPRYSWVREALDALVKFKIADRGAKQDAYRVKYKRSNRDTLKKFGRLVAKLQTVRSSQSASSELALPGVTENLAQNED